MAIWFPRPPIWRNRESCLVHDGSPFRANHPDGISPDIEPPIFTPGAFIHIPRTGGNQNVYMRVVGDIVMHVRYRWQIELLSNPRSEFGYHPLVELW